MVTGAVGASPAAGGATLRDSLADSVSPLPCPCAIQPSVRPLSLHLCVQDAVPWPPGASPDGSCALVLGRWLPTHVVCLLFRCRWPGQELGGHGLGGRTRCGRTVAPALIGGVAAGRGALREGAGGGRCTCDPKALGPLAESPRPRHRPSWEGWTRMSGSRGSPAPPLPRSQEVSE